METHVTQHEYDHEIDEVIDHGWGDLKTWMWIILLAGGLLITTLIVYHFVGQGMLTDWNLGYPPTAPN